MSNSRPFEINRKIKKIILSRLFKHGYATNATEMWKPTKFCGYIGVNLPIQVIFHSTYICIDRLFKCARLETITAEDFNNYVLSVILQTEDFDMKKTPAVDFGNNIIIETEITQRGIGIIFNEKIQEKTA